MTRQIPGVGKTVGVSVVGSGLGLGLGCPDGAAVGKSVQISMPPRAAQLPLLVSNVQTTVPPASTPIAQFQVLASWSVSWVPQSERAAQLEVGETEGSDVVGGTDGATVGAELAGEYDGAAVGSDEVGIRLGALVQQPEQVKRQALWKTVSLWQRAWKFGAARQLALPIISGNSMAIRSQPIGAAVGDAVSSTQPAQVTLHCGSAKAV